MALIYELSTDAKTLANMLKNVEVGMVITYEEMTKAIGRDVRGPARPVLVTARSIVQRENRMIFDCVRSEGLKRLNDGEIVDLSDQAMDRIRRTAKRTGKKLLCVNYDQMPREKQTKHNASLSMFGAISELSKNASTKRLEREIEKHGGEQLPVAKATIAALGI
jgi:hypothetical protein